MKITIRPLTPSLWPDLEALFGRNGASNGCWCMYWRIGPEYHKRPREKNRIAFRRIVKHGPPPGLVAFDGERAVGWCQLTPRQDLSWLNRKPAFQPVDHVPVWSLSCFYIRREYRRRGVMKALIVEALKAAKRANASALEAYPVDTAQPGSTSNIFTGTASTFRRLGFRIVARAKPSRPIMRHDLAGFPQDHVAEDHHSFPAE
jgi:GNAT superfamily N-acetyltransferase